MKVIGSFIERMARFACAGCGRVVTNKVVRWTTTRWVLVSMVLLKSLAHVLVPLHHVFVWSLRESLARNDFWKRAATWIGHVPAFDSFLQILCMLIWIQQQVDDLPPDEPAG